MGASQILLTVSTHSLVNTSTRLHEQMSQVSAETGRHLPKGTQTEGGVGRSVRL